MIDRRSRRKEYGFLAAFRGGQMSRRPAPRANRSGSVTEAPFAGDSTPRPGLHPRPCMDALQTATQSMLGPQAPPLRAQAVGWTTSSRLRCQSLRAGGKSLPIHPRQTARPLNKCAERPANRPSMRLAEHFPKNPLSLRWGASIKVSFFATPLTQRSKR